MKNILLVLALLTLLTGCIGGGETQTDKITGQDTTSTLPTVTTSTTTISSPQNPVDNQPSSTDQSLDPCSQLGNQDAIAFCVIGKAIQTKSAKICEELTVPEGQVYCKQKVRGTPIKGVAGCANLAENLVKAVCLEEVGRIKNDASVCEQITESALYRGICYGKMAFAFNKTTDCEKQGNKTVKQWCYTEIASRNKELLYCEKTPLAEPEDFVNREYCYYLVALAKLDPAACLAIRTKDIKYGCYTNLAQILTDSSICDNIADAKKKKECRSSV